MLCIKISVYQADDFIIYTLQIFCAYDGIKDKNISIYNFRSSRILFSIRK